MCGLSGGLARDQEKKLQFIQDIERLFLLSQVRGQDAAGVALCSLEHVGIIKKSGSVKSLLKDSRYRGARQQALGEMGPVAVLAQCRLATHGLTSFENNNQPHSYGGLVGVHNGIVTEFCTPLKHRPDNDSGVSDVNDQNDSQYIFKNIQEEISLGQSFLQATQRVFLNIKGAASVAVMCTQARQILLATNTGSLYYILDVERGLFFFSSERLFLEDFLKRAITLKGQNEKSIRPLKAGQALLVDVDTLQSEEFYLDEKKKELSGNLVALKKTEVHINVMSSNVNTLHRCTQCILPHTYPFIEFDSHGVCNFCRRYDRQKVHGKDALLQFLEPYRSKDGSPDCLVGLSGGRDSCFGLHLLKTELGMNPVAYTFDWGLTTETSRRNQARMCGQLGVEHILRSANLSVKRKYIQKNVEAFLKSPHLGMVPLFMAGDKEFYQYGRTLRRDQRLPLTVFCAGHSLEQRDFMTGFCGVDENIAGNKRLFQFSYVNKIKLGLFYSSQYVMNPAYINASLFDSFKSFLYSFIYRDDFLYLYEYWPWNEQEIESTLKSKYAWEADEVYGKNQWRMGDGQTAFTNYIYHAVAGFTEFDNYRSNQIREGMLTRDEALILVKQDNEPKMELLKYFASVVGLNLDDTLCRINNIPKLY